MEDRTRQAWLLAKRAQLAHEYRDAQWDTKVEAEVRGGAYAMPLTRREFDALQRLDAFDRRHPEIAEFEFRVLEATVKALSQQDCGFLTPKNQMHAGSHPITETTCDGPDCWCKRSQG